MAAAAQVVCDAAASLLPSLEPILGVAVALNLAYLNLSKFAYIEQIKVLIHDRLQKVDQNVKASIADTPWFKQLCALSGVQTLDTALPAENEKKFWISAPGAWGVLYNIFFYWRIGRALAVLATLYCLSLLILGSAHSARITDWLACHFDKSRIVNDFFISSFAVIWPLITVLVGQFVVWRAISFIVYQTDNLKKAATQEAVTAIAEVQLAIDAQPKQGEMAGPPQQRKSRGRGQAAA